MAFILMSLAGQLLDLLSTLKLWTSTRVHRSRRLSYNHDEELQDSPTEQNCL
jgi:hypothetical protein